MLWTLFDHGCLNPNLLNAVSQAGAHWISLWGQRLDSFVNWMYDLPLSQNWKYLGVRFSPLHLLTTNAVTAHTSLLWWCSDCMCYDCFSAFLWMTCMLVHSSNSIQYVVFMYRCPWCTVLQLTETMNWLTCVYLSPYKSPRVCYL